MTEAVGFMMYTIYLVVGVIVLLNALIAMMSTTYAMIEVSIKMQSASPQYTPGTIR